MKVFPYIFWCVCLIGGLMACKGNQPDASDPAPSIRAVKLWELLAREDAFSNLPLDASYFADLPVTFPESSKHRVLGINVNSVTDKNAIMSVRFVYDPTSGRLTSKVFTDFRRQVYVNSGFREPIWQHNYLFDAKSRLINEKSDKIGRDSEEIIPFDIAYEYKGDSLTNIFRKTGGSQSSGTHALNLAISYHYEGNRRVGATLLGYHHPEARNVPYPIDSTRRRYMYADGNRMITERDSTWWVPCYPNLPCFIAFRDTVSTHRQYDSNVNLINVQTSAPAYLYPKGVATFQYEYNGPDGLISRIVNVNAGLAYQFLYQQK